MKMYMRVLVVAVLAALLVMSFPLSSSAYSGNFNGFNYGIVGFMTSDGFFLDTPRFEINTNGTFYMPIFTGYCQFRIPTFTEFGDHRYSGSVIQFYNNYDSVWMTVETENIDYTSTDYLHTTVNYTDDGYCDVYMDVANCNVMDHSKWSSWYLGNILVSSYGSDVGSYHGWGSPEFNANNAFMCIVKIEYTLDDILFAIDGIRDDLNDVEQAIKDGNMTLSELLQAQKDANDKQDETNEKLDQVNDHLDNLLNNDVLDSTNDALDSTISDVSGFLSGFTDQVDNDALRGTIGSYFQGMGFSKVASYVTNAAVYISDSLGFAAAADFDVSLYGLNFNIIKWLSFFILCAFVLKILSVLTGRPSSVKMSGDIETHVEESQPKLPSGKK